MKNRLLNSLSSGDLVRKPSLLLIIFSAVFAFWFVDFWRPYNPAKGHHNFNSDVMNYYSYLPAKFCNNNSFDFWLGADSLYLPIGPLETFVPRCTYGMSAMYAPFFALGYKIAINQGSKTNGFSEPFATSVRWGSIFYVIVGLFFLRKLLLAFFNEVVTALTLFAVLFGSMLFMYTYGQSEYTHGYLFALFSAFLYYVYRWNLQQKYSYTFVIGLIITLISLIRPTEVFIALFFILWNVRSYKDLRPRAVFLLRNYRHLLLILIIGIVMWIPQFIFWKNHTGSWYYYPYMSEGFFWNDPQFINILFSYRKGWITYTPIVLLAFTGFFFVKKSFPVSGFTFFGITFLMLYVLSCWWDWSFGGCFGARAFCQQIAFLAIPMAFLIDFVFYSEKKFLFKGLISLVTAVFIFSCVCLNIGQTYQYQKGLIHPWATTKDLYWFVFRTYQFNDRFQDDYWAKLRFIDHDKWMRGIDRDDKPSKK